MKTPFCRAFISVCVLSALFGSPFVHTGFTILPEYNGPAYAVTLDEDGELTKPSAVAMPDAPGRGGLEIFFQ